MNYLITGASGGIGAGVAAHLSAQGHTLALHYRRHVPTQHAAAHICADLTASGSGAQVLEEAVQALGHLDGLVCCHGAAQMGLFQDLSEALWSEVMRVNLDSVQKLVTAALPHLIRQKSGNIVLISSMWGISGASCEAAYSAAKGALVTLTRALAKELGPSGIRINCIAPGLIDTAMNESLDASARAALVSDTPLGRIGTAADVAQAVSFFLSEQSSFITGQTLLVDGGYTL